MVAALLHTPRLHNTIMVAINLSHSATTIIQCKMRQRLACHHAQLLSCWHEDSHLLRRVFRALSQLLLVNARVVGDTVNDIAGDEKISNGPTDGMSRTAYAQNALLKIAPHLCAQLPSVCNILR